MRNAIALAVLMCFAAPVVAATYYVDGAAESPSDDNPGTEAQPWKTIARAGSAPELKPGMVGRARTEWN